MLHRAYIRRGEPLLWQPKDIAWAEERLRWAAEGEAAMRRDHEGSCRLESSAKEARTKGATSRGHGLAHGGRRSRQRYCHWTYAGSRTSSSGGPPPPAAATASSTKPEGECAGTAAKPIGAP